MKLRNNFLFIQNMTNNLLYIYRIYDIKYITYLGYFNIKNDFGFIYRDIHCFKKKLFYR